MGGVVCRTLTLLNQIQIELMRGVVYCDAAGEQLTSALAVLDCMRELALPAGGLAFSRGGDACAAINDS